MSVMVCNWRPLVNAEKPPNTQNRQIPQTPQKPKTPQNPQTPQSPKRYGSPLIVSGRFCHVFIYLFIMAALFSGPG